MGSISTAWKLLAAVSLIACTSLACGQETEPARNRDEDPIYDKIVEDFIQYDIGNVADPVAAMRIKARFNGLRADDAVPALVRGLNLSTRMHASCPITALCSKLKAILKYSQDPEVGAHVLRNLELRRAGGYTHHIRGVHTAAENQLIRVQTKAGAEQHFKQRFQNESRLAHTPGRKLTELAARDGNTAPSKDVPAAQQDGSAKSRFAAPRLPAPRARATADGMEPSKVSIDELSDQLKDRATQSKAMSELYRRVGQDDERAVVEHAETIATCLQDGDDATRETAARLLGIIRHQPAVPALIEAIEDSNAQVRSSAATALTRITRQLFGPSDNATPEERRQAITRWREWWSKQGKSAAR